MGILAGMTGCLAETKCDIVDLSQKILQEFFTIMLLVDAMLRTAKPVHYWSEAHQWGPDWPFGSGTNVFVRRPSEEPESLEDAPPVTQPL